VGRPSAASDDVIRRLVRTVDERTATAPLLRKQLRYLFPDHWSFLLGEVALYAFLVLLVTGTYLALFFQDSTAVVVYHGSYAPLRGQQMTQAYRSVVDISTSVKAGLLIRQTHHWAADVFIASIVLHLMRVFFTGAYRKPREVTYWIGLAVLTLSLVEGFLGYSLVDDLLSGMGLAIANGVALSVPLIGGNLGSLVWDGQFPGGPAFFSRMYVLHVFILPALIGTLLVAHVALVALRHHTQFRTTPRATERRLVGVPAFPAQVPRSLGLLFAVAGVLVLLGGLVQINPVWLWGPYHTYSATNGAQPDWYLGWLIGALRIVPGFDVTIDGYTLIPNPFWGGVALPLAVFGFLFVWPLLERRARRDTSFHNLLDRPRDAPHRTAVGCGLLTAVLVVFLAGSADRIDVSFGIAYTTQVWIYRVLLLVGPVVVALLAYRVCIELQRGERVERERRRARQEAAAVRDPSGS
jgi:ubiquinol-cytochrome c reductase cytochrome b subunit